MANICKSFCTGNIAAASGGEETELGLPSGGIPVRRLIGQYPLTYRSAIAPRLAAQLAAQRTTQLTAQPVRIAQGEAGSPQAIPPKQSAVPDQDNGEAKQQRADSIGKPEKILAVDLEDLPTPEQRQQYHTEVKHHSADRRMDGLDTDQVTDGREGRERRWRDGGMGELGNRQGAGPVAEELARRLNGLFAAATRSDLESASADTREIPDEIDFYKDHFLKCQAFGLDQTDGAEPLFRVSPPHWIDWQLSNRHVAQWLSLSDALRQTAQDLGSRSPESDRWSPDRWSDRQWLACHLAWIDCGQWEEVLRNGERRVGPGAYPEARALANTLDLVLDLRIWRGLPEAIEQWLGALVDWSDGAALWPEQLPRLTADLVSCFQRVQYWGPSYHCLGNMPFCQHPQLGRLRWLDFVVLTEHCLRRFLGDWGRQELQAPNFKRG